MKKQILYLFLWLGISTHAQWTLQDSGTTENLNDVYCISADTVVVVGDNATILRTTNGGTDWLSINNPATGNLHKVQFAGTQTGYAIGDNGTLLKTTDGGVSWQSLNTGTTENLYALDVVNATLYIAGSNGLIKMSVDSGSSWIMISNNLADTIANIQMFDNIGYLITGIGTDILLGNSKLYKTEDTGLTWSLLYDETTAMMFVNQNFGVIGCFGYYIITQDACNTVYSTDYSSGNAIIDINITDNDVIWTCGVNALTCDCPHFISKTELINGNYQTTYAEFFAQRIVFYQNIGYMLSINNIYKNTTGINTVGYDEMSMENKVQIFPNPAKEKIQVISSNNLVFDKFQITNTEGKIIIPMIILDKKQIDVSSLQTGIYFLQLFSNKEVYTTKLIIQK